MTSQRMKPRAMSEWIDSAASSAVWPRRSVHARVSFSPAVKKVISSRASRSRAAMSSSADAPPSRKAAASSSGSSASSASSFRSMPPGPFSIAISGFVVSGSSPPGSSPRVVAQRLARVDVGEDLLQLLDLGAQLRVAGLRLLLDALDPLLDVVAVGDEQLELELLEIVGLANDDEQRVDLPQLAERGRSRGCPGRGSSPA